MLHERNTGLKSEQGTNKSLHCSLSYRYSHQEDRAGRDAHVRASAGVLACIAAPMILSCDSEPLVRFRTERISRHKRADNRHAIAWMLSSKVVDNGKIE